MISPTSSILISINGFSIHYYGLIMFFAILTAVLVICFVSKKYFKDVDTDLILDILPVVIIFSILGARFYYVLLDWNYYSKHLSEIFAVWHGGMSIHGGIFGGIISGLVVSKIKKIDFLKYADVFSFGLVLGQAIGRFGNYFNCEAFGKPCNIPYLGLYIPPEHRPFGMEDISFFHPTFLYESIWDIFVFLILFFVIRRLSGLKDGTIFCSYLILYSLGRILIEWCRLDSVLNIAGVAIAQIVSFFVIFISIGILTALYKRKGKI